MDLQKLKKILPIIGIIIFIYIIFNIGLDKILNALSTFPPQYIILLFFLWIPCTSIGTYNWQFILKKQKIKVSYLFLFKTLLIAHFLGSITPGNIGAFSTIFLLKEKSGEPIEKCTTNVLLQTVIASLTLLSLALIGLLLFIQKQYFQSYLPLLIILFLILLILSMIFFVEKIGKKILKNFLKIFLPKKHKKKANYFAEMFYKDFPSLKSIFILIILSFLNWFVLFCIIYLIAGLLLIDIPFIYFIFIYAVGVILESLPISIGGFGIREAGIIPLFLVFGVSPEKVVALGLLQSIFVSWGVSGAVGAFLYLKKQNKNN